MGNKSTASLHGEARLAASRFDEDEIVVLKKIWQDLAERTNGKGIDKEHFLQYFPLNGLLGERLFAQFDNKKNGFIDFDEFILGLSIVSRGTADEKIHFIFDMYNVSHDNKISKQELSTLLNHIPKEVLHGHDMHRTASLHGLPHVNSKQQLADHRSENGGHESGNESDSTSEHGGTMMSEMNDDVEEVDNYTNHDLVEQAFQECDISHEGRLSYQEFKMWIEKNPALLQHIESILPYNGPKETAPHVDKRETLPHVKKPNRTSLSRSTSYAGDMGGMESSRRLSNASQISYRPRQGTITSTQQMSHDMLVAMASQQLHPSSPPQRDISSRLSAGPNDISSPSPRATTPQPPVQNPGSLTHTSSMMATSNDSGLPPHPPTTTSLHQQQLQNHAKSSSLQGGGISISQNSSENNLTLSNYPNHPSMAIYSEDEVAARFYLIQAMEAAQSEALKQQISRLVNSIIAPSPETLASIAAGTFSFPNIYPHDEAVNEVWDEEGASEIKMEGYLWKRGKSMFHLISKRYYLLNGNCLFYYSHESDIRPKGVIFLTGSIIERIKDEEMALKGYFGFELLQQDLGATNNKPEQPIMNRHGKRVLYCKSENERERWIFALQHAAQVVPIEDDYVIGKEIGRGRFSVVCECVHKVTGKRCAVKIIDKASIEPEEKQLLRTEIAVLKLVNHPNIIRFEGIYESKAFIYIVMEMLQGGELFQRIVGRPRFSETEAAKIIRPLLEAIAYLHDLGIVHRDIKPENILCGSELEDLKIADFGLSKMILPKEKMDKPCGTLSYVAPEVLTMQGYGKEADLWSVGVIMFLLMCGKLPFDGEDHNEIVRNTIQGDLKVNATVWSKLSEEAKSLMLTLLNKNGKDRITAREALKHPFIVKYAPKKTHHGSMSSVTGTHTPHSSTASSLAGSTMTTNGNANGPSNAPLSASAQMNAGSMSPSRIAASDVGSAVSSQSDMDLNLMP